MMLTRERLMEILSYDPDTGIFRWRISPRYRINVGDVAGYIGHDGYRRICIKRHVYTGHRLAWLYVHGEWPYPETDHVNGRKDDNRLSNLRLATRTQNCANRAAPSGRRGVSRQDIGWQAAVGRKYVGYFKTLEEARTAYKRAAREIYGEFARLD